jgi:hypothetical protein
VQKEKPKKNGFKINDNQSVIIYLHGNMLWKIERRFIIAPSFS